MNTDEQRHANKINKFQSAVERVGFDKVSDKIGRGATSSFICARDAQVRQQGSVIIAGFISEAQVRADEFCGLQQDEDVYGVLASLH